MPDPTWQELYRAALFESDPGKLRGRVEGAQRSIQLLALTIELVGAVDQKEEDVDGRRDFAIILPHIRNEATG
jgi:hypothetical protein